MKSADHQEPLLYTGKQTVNPCTERNTFTPKKIQVRKKWCSTTFRLLDFPEI